MKKILAVLCLLFIFGGTFENNVSANGFDQIPPVLLKSSIDQFSHLEL